MAKSIKIILFSLALFVSLVPVFSYAASAVTTKCPASGNYESGIFKGLPCDEPWGKDPSKAIAIAEKLAVNIGQILLEVLAVIFIIMFIVGGIQYISAGGNENRANAGKKTLSAAVIGLLISILAFAIVKIFATFIGGGVG